MSYLKLFQNKMFVPRQAVLVKKGFTIIELIIVTTVSLILISLSLSTFYNVSDRQTLEKEIDYSIALIEKARLQTVNSKDNSYYSIRLSSSTITLYRSNVFSTTASSSSHYVFSPKVEISNISLTGNVSDIAFQQITGSSNATGTITFRLKNNQSASTTIRLYKTGLVEII
jgi:prepilin-type N-terminal cleavage/methylation domain-containing protein